MTASCKALVPLPGGRTPPKRSGQQLSGEASKTKAIVAAMETYVKLKSREELLALRGKICLEYDWERSEEEELICQRQREALLEASPYRIC